MIRPPPGSTPGQSARTSPPQADRSTNSTSRGRIGRSTSGAAAGAADVAGLVPAVAAAPAVAGVPLLAAAPAFSQPAVCLGLCFSRHCQAGAPPVVVAGSTLQ